MTSSGHATKVKEETTWRLSQMSKVCGRSWGGNSSDLRSFYRAYVASVFNYSSNAVKYKYQTARKCTESSARLITACLDSTRVKSLLLEAGLLPLDICFRYQCMVAAERCRRLPLSDPLCRRAFTCPGEKNVFRLSASNL